MDRCGIAVAGTIIVDTINSIHEFPSKGELAHISSVSKATGGCVPNVAADLKQIDKDLAVSAIGCIGNDDDGNLVRQVLESYGVDTSRVKTVPMQTDFTQVMSVVGGQRTFFTYSGTSAKFGIEDMDFSELNSKILHLGYFLLLKKIDEGDGLKILKKAKESGLMTSIDLVSENSDKYKNVIPCLSYTDYLIVNELEGGRIAGMDCAEANIPAVAKQLLKLGVREKVIIHFAHGSVCASKDGRITSLGSFILPEGFIKGTTGAGDAFCSGALYGIYNGLSDDQILEYGTVCATMALSTQDAVSGVTDIESAKKLCAKFERRNIK